MVSSGLYNLIFESDFLVPIIFIYLYLCWRAATVIIVYGFVMGFLLFLIFNKYFKALNELLLHSIGYLFSCPVNKYRTRVCPICEERDCSNVKNTYSVMVGFQYTDGDVSTLIDDALQDLCELVVDRHVDWWYSEVGDDPDFLLEVRRCLRALILVLYERVNQVSARVLLRRQVIPAMIRHVAHFQGAVEEKSSAGISQSFFRSLGEEMHVAVHSRTAELKYVEMVLQGLLPLVLPTNSRHCELLQSLLVHILSMFVVIPAMDVLADPDTFNLLFLLLVGEDDLAEAHCEGSMERPLLSNYGNYPQLTLCDVLTDQIMRDAFGDFLRGHSVPIFELYLRIEGLIRVLFNNEANEQSIRAAAEEMYTQFFLHESPWFLLFTVKYKQRLETVIFSRESRDIVRLRCTPALFELRASCCDLLERVFLPVFRRSVEYYQTVSVSTRQSTSRNAKLKGRNIRKNISKMTAKIANIFRFIRVGTGDETDGSSGGDSQLAELPSAEEEAPSLHDMNKWVVVIRKVVDIDDSKSGDVLYKFKNKQKWGYLLESYASAVPEQRHFVVRKHTDFYMLANKLRSFHGDLAILQNLPRKSFGDKLYDFLIGNIDSFQAFLKRLHTNHSLRTSELVHSFIVSPNFSPFLGENIRIGEIIKSVPRKLVREKGQNLDGFIQLLVTSSEPPRSRECRVPSKNVNAEEVFNNNLFVPLYKNLANQGYFPSLGSPVPAPQSSLMDSLCRAVDICRTTPNHLFVSLLGYVRLYFSIFIDGLFDLYFKYKISTMFVDHQVVAVITLLKESLFGKPSPTTPAKRLHAKKSALSALQNKLVPGVLVSLMGSDSYNELVTTVFDCFQQPLLNKQINYVLLDFLLAEMFPELES